MKSIYRSLTLTLFFLIPAALLFSQSPCVRANGEPTKCDQADGGTVNAAGTGRVRFQLYDDPTSLTDPRDLTIKPRYKAFWLPGDGNFIFHAGGTTLAEDATSWIFDYTYGSAGSAREYRLNAVLTEKKSNMEPPGSDERIINVPPNTVGTATAEANRLRVPGRETLLDIFYNDPPRPRYPTAFVVSFPKEDASISRILLFYNSCSTGGAVDTVRFFQRDVYYHPFYYGAGYAPHEGTPTDMRGRSYDNTLFTEPLGKQFLNYIEFPISSDARGLVPERFYEQRVFPVFKTIWSDTIPKEPSHFLAVSVGPNPLPSDDQFNDQILRSTGSTTLKGGVSGQVLRTYAELVAAVRATAQKQFPGLGGDLQVGRDAAGNALYIRGIASTDVNLVGSHDPNELEVMSICPKGFNKYECSFRMQVCNHGTLLDQNFPVTLFDSTGGQFSNLDLSGVDVLAGSLQTGANTWKFTWSVSLDGVPLPPAPGQPYDERYPERCKEFTFKMTTTWLGVQALIRGEGMKACVHFPLAGGDNLECNCNGTLPLGEVLAQNGYNCGSPVTGSFWSCWCCMALVLLLLLFILWLLWRILFKK